MAPICEIDASAVARSIDRPLSDWTPQALREAFLVHGCAIVRRAVDAKLLDRVRSAVEAAYETTSDVHVYDRDIRAVTKRALSGYEVVGDPKLRQFLKVVYAGQFHLRKNATARRIEGSAQKSGWQEPLLLHLDSQIHRPQFTVNFWVPFQDCGVDRPVLQVVPLDYIRTRSYSGFTGEPLRAREDFNLAYFKQNVFEVDAVRQAFGENCLLRPVMQAGDLIVASNWLIHGSYRTPAMTTGRISLELRFIGTALDIAPHLQPLAQRVVAATSGRGWRTFARAEIAAGAN